MYFLDIYQPMLSHIAHLLRAFPDGKDCIRMGGQQIRETAAECVQLVHRVKNEAAERPNGFGGESWFPVHAWLAEKLPALPFGRDIADALPSIGENVPARFKSRLDELVLKTSAGTATPGESELFELYIACLDLGFGEQNDPIREEKRRRYLHLCRSVLTARTAPKNRKRTGLFSRLSARAAALLIAPAATAALYCLYRVWLHSLLVDVIG